MGQIAISVEHLGKCYRIGHAAHRPENARAAVRSFVTAPFAYLRSRLREPSAAELFWALKDVSFEVRHGEVLGVIGRNGAGKSTLLKILSRITEPTEGCAKVYGRVGSLLEVGTGFHPELTGRENIFLNGSILGMRRYEIVRQFDEIVDFSGVAKFLDTPVKHYSSGMYVRLAFAVAAHLQPEILLIDEVLAVGDSQFQKQCLEKMETVSHEGKTVVFVSHNMPIVNSLCQHCLLLNAGKIMMIGKTSEVIHQYYSGDRSDSQASVNFANSAKPIGDTTARLLFASVNDLDNTTISEILISHDFKIVIGYRILIHTQYRVIPNVHFYRSDGTCAFISHAYVAAVVPPGDYCAECYIPGNLLNDDIYFVSLVLTTYDPILVVHCSEPHALSFMVRDPIQGTLTRGDYRGPYPGSVRPLLQWNIFRL